MMQLAGFLRICVLLLIAVGWLVPTAHGADAPVHGQTVTLEDFGGQAFYRPFLGGSQLEAGRWSLGLLNVYPLDDGRSRVRFTGEGDVFDESYLGKQFAGIRINHNTLDEGDGSYLPDSHTTRFSRVVAVEDGRNLIVDFAYNGGNRAEPQPSLDARGFFFFDNASAIRQAIAHCNENPGVTTVLLRPITGSDVYATMGFESIQTNLSRSPLFFASSDPQAYAGIRVVAEDAFADLTRTLKANIPQNNFFELNDGGHDCGFERVHIMAPLVTLEGSLFVFWSATIFNYEMGQPVERTLFYDGDSEYERERLAAEGIVDEQFTWNGMGLAYLAGGGTYDETDVTGYQSLRVRNGRVRAITVASIKSTNGAGNFIDWDGGAAISNSATSVTQFDNVKVQFRPFARTGVLRREDSTPFDLDYGNREALIVSEHNFWVMYNQYWLGGIGYAYFNPINLQVEIGDKVFPILFGNDGDWRYFELYQHGMHYGSSIGYNFEVGASGKRALFADEIPVVGQRFAGTRHDQPVPGWREAAPDRTFICWGLGLQEGDRFRIGDQQYTITQRWLPSGYGRIQKRVQIPGMREGFEAMPHYNAYVVDRDLPAEQNWTGTVTLSQTQVLLNGETWNATLRYNQGEQMNRHAFYNDLNVGFSFRNMTIDGNLRGSGRFDGTLRSLPRTREYINVNKARGFDQVIGTPDLARRNELENHAHDRVFLIRNTITPMVESRENILLDNATIVGQSRMRNPRIVNGIRLGDAAYQSFRLHQQILLVDGFEVDLAGAVIGCMSVSVQGQGKVICDNLVSLEDPDNPGQFGALTIQPGTDGSLEVIGSGGRSGVVLAGRDNPAIARQRVNLTDWTFLPGLRNRTGLVVRWNQDDPAFAANVLLEGKQQTP